MTYNGKLAMTSRDVMASHGFWLVGFFLSFQLSVIGHARAGSAADATLCPLGRNRNANTSNTISAPTDGTIQIDRQSCVTVRHVRAAAPAASHAGFGAVYRLTTAPDTNAPMK
jgi:hypothetical protein